jgi:RNA polymerase subunit RPABC4/transcription elongation factor Spt4
MSEDTSIRVMNCSNCGEIVKEGINFCPYCSRKVDMGRLIIKEIDKGKDNRSP